MKFYSRFTLLALLFLSLFAVPAFAQTITIGTVDPGPYAPGSSIAVPIHIDDPLGKLATNNIYTLYLSDATGSFAAKKSIGTFTGYFATFVNGVIPTNGLTIPGAYKVRVEANAPATISADAAINLANGTPITASAAGVTLNLSGAEVFANCNNPLSLIRFTDNSTNTTSLNITLHDEFTTPTPDVTITPTTGSTFTFNTSATNYTLLIKASDGITKGTKAYTIVNNNNNNSFGTSGTPSACLGTDLTFNVDYTSTDGIQHNYPGNTYQFDWGDNSKTTLTYFQIVALSGHVSHAYTTSSCGSIVNGKLNVFKVGILPISPYCGTLTEVSTTAKILAPAKNIISGPTNACTGVVIFNNQSDSGNDPNSTTDCSEFAGARYTWFVDGNNLPGFSGVPKSKAFNPTLTHGTHIITLQYDNNQSCGGADVSIIVCVQDPPKPKFVLPITTTCTGTTITPTDQTIFDLICPGTNTYTWSVTPNTFSYTGGTNANSVVPQFIFNSAGIYQIKLAVATPNCGSVDATPQQIVVNSTATASLSTDASICGLPQLTFDPNATTTKTTLTGTTVTQPDTYTWTITGGQFNFAAGSTLHSQYPKINFTEYNTYTITVSHQNTCNTVTATQQLTFKQAPTVTASASQNLLCQGIGNTVALTGVITPNAVYPIQWLGGLGNFSPSRNVANPIYTPAASETGNVVFTMQITTALPGQCNIITSNPVTVNVVPTATGTSSATAICSGTTLNYVPTASNPGSTFTWTATGSTDISGYTSQNTPQTNPLINDVLVNADNNASGTVTYTITPTSNGCQGTPFTYTVTVNPKAVLAPPLVPTSVCSGKPFTIELKAIPAGTKFTWTVSGTPGAGGFSARTIAATGDMVQTLTNSTTSPVTVTYLVTPVSPGNCTGAPVSFSVVVDPSATIADAGPATFICDLTSTTLRGNQPFVGTGKWTERDNLPVTFTDDTKYNTGVTNLVPGTIYHFIWTIAPVNNCGVPSSSTVVVTDYAASVGGIALAANGTNKLIVCSGDISGNTLTLSGNTGNVIRWEKSTDGTTWTSVAGNNTNLTYTFAGLTQSTSFRAVVLSGNCLSANSTQVDVTVNPKTATANAGLPQVLCNQPGTILNGNQPSGTTGKWTVSSGQSNVIFDNDTKPNANVSGLVGGQTYVLTWTLSGLAPCGPTNKDVTITNQAPIAGNTIVIQNNTTTVCQGSVVKIQGNSAPTGGSTFYAYTWEKSTDNGQNWSTITGEISADLNIQIVAKTAIRRTVISGSCSSTSTPVTVDISAPVTNNSLAISTQICVNTKLLNPITGSTPHGGDEVNFLYQWQRSTNALTGFVDIPGATAADYLPTQVFTTDMYYRRIVSTAYCTGAAGNISDPIHVIVTPDIVAKFNANTQIGCAPFNLTAQNISAVADPNAKEYVWTAINANGVETPVGTGLSFPSAGYLIPFDGVTVTIKLTVKNKFDCRDASVSMDFSTVKNTSFTVDKASGCGPQTIKFTNTTASAINTTYTWDFGDGSAKYVGTTPPNHTYQPDATGNDAVYTVRLTAGDCVQTLSSKTITVYPLTPKAFIDPGASTGCAPYTITVKNITPGTNDKYVFELLDENDRPVQTITKLNNDKSNAIFAPVSTTTTLTYKVRMTTTNLCSQSAISVTSPIVITSTGLSARMTVSPTTNTGIVAGCAPFMVDFHNLSTGGNLFVYNIYYSDFTSKESVPAVGSILNYYFDTPGVYYVDLSVSNACGGFTISPKTQITVYPVPAPAFTVDATTGCGNVTVNFTNKTPNISPTAPANSFTYTWDFGDGSPTVNGFTPPPHTYDYKKSPYTVTLSAVNSNGCSRSVTQTGIIVVHPPPLTDFTALPDTITSIPNYSFAFVDKTKNAPVSWVWDFGDKSGSTSQNPSHIYADTGKYVVTLTTVTAFGCTDSKTHIVRITGVPGQLYVPNAFMPTSLSQELRVFTIKGSGLKQYSLRIINNWGQTVFQTSKLDARGEPTEFWDGKFKGQDAPQGVYAWEISASFINGTEWKGMSFKGGTPKRAGTLTLIK